MTRRALGFVIVSVVASAAVLAAGSAQDKPTVKVPQPGVPQIMTIEGEFIRVAYNNEGFVTLGYRVANQSVGDEWMLLEIGATVREGRPNQRLKRDALSLETPDGKTIPLPTQSEYQQSDLRALEKRSEVVRDSINYFPPTVTRGCRIGFFARPGEREMSYNEVELTNKAGCLGRLYFKVPGGIQYGQHWLNVKFQESLVRVPFRILTDQERKTLSKNYGDIKKQVEAAFKKKGS